MLMRDISQALPVTKSIVLTHSFTPIQNLLNHLCELSDLLVVSCSSVFPYKMAVRQSLGVHKVMCVQNV